MRGFGDSKVPSETWEDNYNYLPAHQCPVNFRLYKELNICINECGWHVLMSCNFFQYLFAHLLTVNEVIMFRIVICCPNKIWNLKDDGVSTVLPSDVKILFPKEHLSEFFLEGVLIVCILMQEHSQGRCHNYRNAISPVLLMGSILSEWDVAGICVRNSCGYMSLLNNLWLGMLLCGISITVLICDLHKV